VRHPKNGSNCQRAGHQTLIGLKFQVVKRHFESLDEVLIWIDRNQLGRRNLTDEQRAVIMGRLYKTAKQNPTLNLKQFQTDNGDRGLKLSPRGGSHATAKAIAEQVGVGQATIRRAEKFTDAVEALQEVSPQAAERVLRGEVRDALTELPRVPKEALSFVAKKIEEGKRVIKEILREWRYQQLEAPPLPQERFDVIYADPPWEYEFSVSERREIENQYPTMTLEEIKQLEIPAADNAVLFLWAPPPKLPEALEVMRAWGFRYVTCAVWDKEKIGMGYWFRQQHELLLVGVKGNFSPPPPDKRFPSVIRSPRPAQNIAASLKWSMKSLKPCSLTLAFWSCSLGAMTDPVGSLGGMKYDFQSRNGSIATFFFVSVNSASVTVTLPKILLMPRDPQPKTRCLIVPS
jgi:16S rRNA G966 N2-methylase RsmD